MIEIKTKNDYFNLFDNITELADYVTTKQRKAGRNNSSNELGNEEWYGTKNFDEALNLLKYGDDKLYEKIKEEKARLEIKNNLGNVKNRLAYKNDVCGYIPNVPNYLKGYPINMINCNRNRLSHRIINIFLNIRVNGGVQGSDIIRIGSKYLTVIDMLEKKGYRCNLYSGVANDDYGNYSFMLVRVKTDKEPLNLKKICFTIANPSMQRRIKFRWMEVNDGYRDFTDGYGDEADGGYIKKFLNKVLKDDVIVWNYESFMNYKSVEEIINDLKSYGINVLD